MPSVVKNSVSIHAAGPVWRILSRIFPLEFSLSFKKRILKGFKWRAVSYKQPAVLQGDPNGAINSGLILQVYNRVCKPRQCFSSAHFQGSESFENYFCNSR